MNIFFLNRRPYEAANMLHKNHVNKMLVEAAQMLCTAHRMLDGEEGTVDFGNRKAIKYIIPDRGEYSGMLAAEKCELYWDTHHNHPCSIWVRESSANYKWLYRHMMALGSRYWESHGFYKEHKTIKDLRKIIQNPPAKIKHESKFRYLEIPQCMPDSFKRQDPYEAYKVYYNYKLKYFALMDMDHEMFMEHKGLSDPAWIQARDMRYRKEQRRASRKANKK